MNIYSPVISGSLTISGSIITTGGGLPLTGSLVSSGSFTSIGNTTVSGSLLVTGSIGIGTNIIYNKLDINQSGSTSNSVSGVGLKIYADQGNDASIALSQTARGTATIGMVSASSAPADMVIGTDVTGNILFKQGMTIGNLSSGTTKMMISSSGNIGIGTTTPIYNDVVMPYAKTATSTAASFFIRSNEAPASNPFGLRFQIVGGATNSVRYAALQTTEYNNADGGNIILQPAGGNFGIGVFPGSFFEAYSNSNTTNIAYFTTSGSANRMILGAKNVGNNALIDIRAHGSTYTETVIGNSMTNAVGVVGYTPALTPMVVGTTTNSPLVFGTNNLEVMRITGSFVGIGITSPSYALHILPTATYGNAEDGNIAIRAIPSGGTVTSPTTAGGIVFGDTNLANSYMGRIAVIQDNPASSTTSHMRFYTNAGGGNGATAERMRITGAGNVGVNTAGSICRFVVADAGTVITSGDVTFDSQAKGIELYNTISGTTDNLVGYWFSNGPHKAGLAAGRTNAGAGWELDMRFFTHNSATSNLNHTYENMRLYGNGNLTINGSLTSNGGLSDINLKENLVKISSPLDKISQINGYTFDWKEGTPPNGEMLGIVHDAGLIAQEVETIIPDIVRENKWDGTKMLNYNGVTALLVEAIKELKAQNDALQARIETLEQK
jgi:hypothetical protein